MPKKDILDRYRQEYEKVSMSEEAYKIMRARMEQGKKEKLHMKKKKTYIGWIAAAAAALTIVILPNTSASVASPWATSPYSGNFSKW